MVAKPSLSRRIRNLVRIVGLLAGGVIGFYVIGPLTSGGGDLTGAVIGLALAGGLLYLVEANAVRN